MALNVKKCKLLCITYCKSGVVTYVYNIYQANVVSDDISPALALLAEKTLRRNDTYEVFLCTTYINII